MRSHQPGYLPEGNPIVRRFLSDWKGRILALWLLIALFGDFIANERPLYARLEGEAMFPVFREYAEWVGIREVDARFVRSGWRDQPWEQVLFPLVPYSASTIDINNLNFTGPFENQRVPHWRFRHWLGTDSIGRDVTAGIIEGLRTSLFAGLLAMLIASLIGLILGSLAGYFGDHRVRWTWARWLANVLGVILGGWLALGARRYALIFGEQRWWEWTLSLGLFLVTLVAANRFAGWINKRYGMRNTLAVPVDLLVMRLVELFHSVPLLLLILAMLAIIRKPSLWHVVLIIGLVSWTGIARFCRAEFLRIKHQEYVEASRALGFSDIRIMWRHILPNAIRPLLIVFSFGVAGAILAESVLSFLGIGNPGDTVTWGGMLRQARGNIQAWWMAVFPGLALFFTVVLFNMWGEQLSGRGR